MYVDESLARAEQLEGPADEAEGAVEDVVDADPDELEAEDAVEDAVVAASDELGAEFDEPSLPVRKPDTMVFTEGMFVP